MERAASYRFGCVALVLAMGSGCSAVQSTASEPSCQGGKCDVWGLDDRHEPYELDASFVERFVKPVGMLAERRQWEPSTITSLGERRGLCDDVRYADQPTVGSCTGFVAGNDIFVTAAHCLRTESNPPAAELQQACDSKLIIFDFAYSAPPDDPMAVVHAVGSESIYSCKEVLLHRWDESGTDVAIVRLDRRVTNRAALAVRTDGNIAVGEGVFMVGHPSGIPAKVATAGFVVGRAVSGQGNAGPVIRDGRTFYFGLEMFGGNSGGPIINVRTGVVEGVASQYSGKNFVDSSRGCRVLGECGDNATCPWNPGAYALTSHASAIAHAVRGEPLP